MDKILLIDGNSIMNRAFYGIMGRNILQTPDGVYTNAIYGFLQILFKTMEDLDPKYIAVAFDLKGPTKRHEIYEEYKAGRHATPEELIMQFPIIKEILDAMNIKRFEMEGYEADDILGTIAKKYGKDLEVEMLTGDRDYFQLIDKNISVILPRTRAGVTEDEYYDIPRIEKEFGIKPIDFIQIKGLQGDSSDNIPGVPGIGEKTALKLIQEYKSIDGLYEAIERNKDNLSPKQKEKLIEFKEQAYLSKELGRIDLAVPLKYELKDILKEEWNNTEVFNLFFKLQLNKFIERFKLKEKLDEDNVLLEDFIESQSYLEDLPVIEETSKVKEIFKNNKMNSFTYSLVMDNNTDILKRKIKTIDILFFNSSFNKQDIGKIRNEKLETKDIKIEEVKKKDISSNIFKINLLELNDLEYKQALETIFLNSLLKVGYNVKEEYLNLFKIFETNIKENIINENTINIDIDLKIGSYLLNSIENRYSVKDLMFKYFNLDITEFMPKENKQQSMFEEEEKDYSSYFYLLLYPKILSDLSNTSMLDLYFNIEMPLAKVLANIQYQGIIVNKAKLLEFGEILDEEIGVLTKEIIKIAGEDFNINSPQQVGIILFEKLGLKYIKKTKTGYSTDVETLNKLIQEHPIIEKILEYRKLSKLNSTYVQGMIPYINEETNKIHSYFHQTVTATGRISSTEPNLQNIPTRTELGKELRKAFIASNGNILIDADYSQIELRILASMSDDIEMIDAFNKKQDIHTSTASKVFNIPIEDVSSDDRRNAKAVNFGIIYGISDYGLAEQTGLPFYVAKEYIKDYLEKYQGVDKYMKLQQDEAKEKGYVTTLFNRRRYIPEIKSPKYMIREFGKRAAMNAPIQGTAADIMKIAMIRVYNRLIKENLKSRIILQIHDEILIDTLESEKDKVIEILKQEMKNAAKLKVDLDIEIQFGKTWYDTH